jgi:hypothetical protein
MLQCDNNNSDNDDDNNISIITWHDCHGISK